MIVQKYVTYAIAVLTATSLLLFAIGCSSDAKKASSSSTPSNSATTPVAAPGMSLASFTGFGASLQIPKQFENPQQTRISFQNFDQIDLYLVSDTYIKLEDQAIKAQQNQKLADSAASKAADKLMERNKIPLFQLNRYKDTDNKTPQDLTGSDNATELGRQEGFLYTIHQPAFEEREKSKEILSRYQEIKPFLPDMRKNAQLIPIDKDETQSVADQIPTFSTTDIDGNPVTNDIFKGHKVTMINIWGTFCGPCIEEMPSLGELANQMPDGTQLIGMMSDVRLNDDKNLSFAKEILQKANATFPNLKRDDGLDPFLNSILAEPTTLFVDANGKLLGDPVAGVRTKEGYLEELQKRLQS